MITIRNSFGNTVLHNAIRTLCSKLIFGCRACRSEPVPWAELAWRLVYQGSDVHAQNHHGETPLDIILKIEDICCSGSGGRYHIGSGIFDKGREEDTE